MTVSRPDHDLPPADGAGFALLVTTAAALGARLRDRGWMIATVESCTGGGIATALTEVAGSSAWFDRGWVTYTNDSKREMVGVSDETLRAHGAVSEQTAAQMAAGGLQRSRANVAVSVTGIAGPSGATPGKPVGTVCFAWAIEGRELRTETLRFEGDRASVRFRAAMHALSGVQAILMADPKD